LQFLLLNLGLFYEQKREEEESVKKTREVRKLKETRRRRTGGVNCETEGCDYDSVKFDLLEALVPFCVEWLTMRWGEQKY
jgi:hypothetical protein